MPDTKEVIVTLRLQGAEGESSEKEPSVDVGSEQSNKGDSKAKAVFGVLAAQVGRVAAKEAVAWAEYQWNKELNLNDDYVGQRGKRVAMQYINGGISFATALLSGAAMGSVLGPGGAIAGAVVAGATSAAEIVRQQFEGREQQQIAINQMNAQLGYTRQRSGWSLEAASIGEDL